MNETFLTLSELHQAESLSESQILLTILILVIFGATL